MLNALLLSAAIQASNPSLPPQRRDKFTNWVLEEARERNLDPWVFQAIIHQETRWTATAVRREHDGSCSVGLGQINTRCGSEEVATLLNPHNNIKRMGKFLSRIRRACRRDCAGLGWLRAYNPGDAAYLAAVQAAVRSAHAQDGQRIVQGARAPVHVSRMQVHAASRPSGKRGLEGG